MLTATTRKVTRKSAGRKLVRFAGICGDAAALGVNRVTLYRVLTGERADLRGLRARYDALKRGA